MRRKRNMSQMNKQEKTTAKELKEMEISKMLDKEFKVLYRKILIRLKSGGSQ